MNMGKLHSVGEARVRRGEEDFQAEKVFDELRVDPGLVVDCAILSAQIYSNYAGLPVDSQLPELKNDWREQVISLPDIPPRAIKGG